VTRPQSAKRIKTELSHLTDFLTILQNDNLKGVQQADVVLLACKPYNLTTVLQEEGMLEALAGKLLISILAGVSVGQIEDTIHGIGSSETLPADPASDGRCRIVRVMPNTASLICESMTVIATSNPPLPQELNALVTWMFNRIGRVVSLPPAQMDASTALCGSGPAFFALVLEAMADGAVAMGLPRAEAQLMAAQTMRGTAGLVLNGEHPALVREKVSTPGGCTIGGLLVLEEGTVRGTLARGVREATVVASQLGMGAKGVNGTRF
jgi:pyrroline-5-carboxylate reductase